MDKAIGIAVLQGDLLFAAIAAASGFTDVVQLPVYRKGTKSNWPDMVPQWCFYECGGRLILNPSLRILGEEGQPDNFHSPNTWSVEFIELPDDPERDGFELCREMSREIREEWRRGKRF